MKAKELKKLGTKELDEKLLELKKELLKVRGQISVGTIPKSPGKVKNIRHTIASILSIKSQKSNEGGTKSSA